MADKVGTKCLAALFLMISVSLIILIRQPIIQKSYEILHVPSSFRLNNNDNHIDEYHAKQTYAMLIWDAQDVGRALTLCWSIHELDNNTNHEITLFVSGYSAFNASQLQKYILHESHINNIFRSNQAFITRFNILDLPHFPIHIKLQRPEWRIAWDKLELFNPNISFSTIIYLDIDMFLQRPISELFNLKYPAFTPHAWSHSYPLNRINGGFIVIKPDILYYDTLLKYGHLSYETDVGAWIQDGDQTFLQNGLKVHSDNTNFIMLSYIYNEVVEWCHMVKNLDYVKVWHSCAGFRGIVKFWRSIQWDANSARFIFRETWLKNKTGINYHQKDKKLVDRKAKHCRLYIFKCWFKRFDAIQLDIKHIVDIIQAHHSMQPEPYLGYSLS